MQSADEFAEEEEAAVPKGHSTQEGAQGPAASGTHAVYPGGHDAVGGGGERGQGG